MGWLGRLDMGSGCGRLYVLVFTGWIMDRVVVLNVVNGIQQSESLNRALNQIVHRYGGTGDCEACTTDEGTRP